MSTGLILPGQNTAIAEDKQFDEISKSFNFLPRLQLFQPTSQQVTSDIATKGEFGIVSGKDVPHRFGESVELLPILYRYKALDMSGETPLAFHHKAGETITKKEYLDIVERAKGADSNCSHGPEFLVWVPRANLFATFHLGSTTARNSGQDVRALMVKGLTGTFKSKLLQSKDGKKKWYGFTVTAFAGELENIPAQEALDMEVQRFVDVKDSQVTLASEVGGQSTDSDRPQ